MAQEKKLPHGTVQARKGDRLKFNHKLQAWFPEKDERAEGPATATLLADCLWEKEAGLRTRAIQVEIDEPVEKEVNQGDGNALQV